MTMNRCLICGNDKDVQTCTVKGRWPSEVIGLHYCKECYCRGGDKRSGMLPVLRKSMHEADYIPGIKNRFGRINEPLDDKAIAALTDNHKTNVKTRQNQILRERLNRPIPTKNEKELARKHPWDLGFSGASWED